MSDVKEISLELQTAKQMVADGDALDRLCKNKDFNRIIRTRYLQEEPVRLTHMLANPVIRTDEQRADIHRELQAIALVASFLNTVGQMADSVRGGLREAEAELERAQEEDQE